MKHVPGEPRPDRTTLIRVLAAATAVPVVASVLLVQFLPNPPAALSLLPLMTFLWQTVAILVAAVPVGVRAAFVAVPGEFRVTVRPSWAAIPVMWGSLICLQAFGPGDRPAGIVALWLGFEACVLLTAVRLFARPVVVSLSATGVTVHGFFRRSHVYAWDELPEFPAVVSAGDFRRSTVYFMRPGRWRLGLRQAWVNSRFLADAITYYRWRPEFRAEIGTPAEHRRLYAALVEAYAVSGGGRRSSVAAR